MSIQASNANPNSLFNLKDIDLRVLDYIPGFSTGSGIARICFGAANSGSGRAKDR